MEDIRKIRFKHLKSIVEGEIDYPKIMEEVFGYKNRRWLKTIRFKKSFLKAYKLIQEIEHRYN